MTEDDHKAAVEEAAEMLRDFFSARPEDQLPEDLDDFLLLARNGVEYVHHALCSYATQLLKKKEPLPHDLQLYLTETALKPFKAEDTKAFKNLLRDVNISTVVIFVRRRTGCNVFRNESTKTTPSACSLVSEALLELGMNVNEANVVRIVKRIDKLHRGHLLHS